MEIVPFSKKDQQETAAFIRSITQEMGWPEVPPHLLNNLADYFNIPTDGFLFLVKQNNTIIGMGGCITLQTHESLIKRFYIAKDYRGTGIASQLLEKIIRTAKTANVSRIVIDVAKKNSRAIRFYEKNGFVQYKQLPVTDWQESNHPEIFNYYYLSL